MPHNVQGEEGIEAANTIKQRCRAEDVIARWGGDAFLILLPKTESKTAEEIVKEIRNLCIEKSEGKRQLSIL